MSFLNSVLDSINGGKSPIKGPPAHAPKVARPVADNPSTAGGVKRKASGELFRPTEKAQKSTSSPANLPGKLAPRPRSAGPASSSSSAPKANKPDATKAAAQAAKVPPKKGSYAEILARAKQNTSTQVGQLTHKPKEKEKLSTKKELLLQKEQARLKKQGKLPSSVKDSAAGSKNTSAPQRTAEDLKQGRKPGIPPNPKNAVNTKRPQPTYQGTAKPKAPQPAYRGTMKPGSSSNAKRGYDSEPDRGRSIPARQRRGGYSDYDSEEEAESDDGYDYASDDYSDMDAGFDDVDEEEEAAALAAKKEDQREQRKLEELARQKAERKKKAQAGR